MNDAKVYSRLLAGIIILAVVPVILFQLTIIERISWQDLKIERNYKESVKEDKRLNKEVRRFQARFDVEVTFSELLKAEKKLRALKREDKRRQKRYKRRGWK